VAALAKRFARSTCVDRPCSWGQRDTVRLVYLRARPGNSVCMCVFCVRVYVCMCVCGYVCMSRTIAENAECWDAC